MKYLEKYAKLIINKGVNIQPGQKLMIRSGVEQAFFARVLAQAAWDAGAADVYIQYNDEIASRIAFLSAPDERFPYVPDWLASQIDYVVKKGYNLVSIISQDPEILKGVDPERISKQMKAMAPIGKPLSDQATSNAIQWSLASVPNPAWARKVFPDAATDEEAIDNMWEAIYHASRIDDNDPIDNWNAHIASLSGNAKKLMNHNFTHLTLTNDLGTDLTLELPTGHIWVACGEEAQTGNTFIANIPTEEVFTAPHRTGTNGIVYATKPLIYMGNVIDDFWIQFKDGEAIAWDAKVGKEILEKLLHNHANAKFLGEVALVPHSSPISQSGLLWYNTLYDENASCHLALGRGYNFTLAGTENKTEAELIAMGLNQSMEHSDFMIGSADMRITGTTHDGKEVTVFEQGEWVL